MILQTNKQTHGSSWGSYLRLVLAVVFVVLFINTAWVSDDAYIILRTVDNALHGHGLRWNIAERVQSYTCPLWTLILCGGCGLTGEYYFTTVALSFLLSVATVYLIGWRLASSAWAAVAGLAALISSRAFMDYTSSGLENALGYLLLAIFLWLYIRPSSLKNIFLMSLTMALAMTNRMDVVLLCGFPLLYSAYRLLSVRLRPGSKTCRRLFVVVALGMLPFIAWEIFSIIYYGFPFPNTAYAKLHTGIPALKLIYRGFLYGLDSLTRDPLTLIAIGVMFVMVALRGGWRLRWAGVGVAAYLLYTTKVGGDFMSGRFFALPFLAACVIVAQQAWSRRAAARMTAACLALGLLAERPTFFAGPSYENKHRPNYIADERGYYYQWTGFWPVLRNGGEPRGAWVDAGKALKASGTNVVPGDSVGLTGFFAGPDVHIVDRLALCDPLLARMEIPDKERWRVGHYERRLPVGYEDTLRLGKNRIQEVKLRQLHDVLFRIARGPVWSASRFSEIARINGGFYDELMREM